MHLRGLRRLHARPLNPGHPAWTLSPGAKSARLRGAAKKRGRGETHGALGAAEVGEKGADKSRFENASRTDRGAMADDGTSAAGDGGNEVELHMFISLLILLLPLDSVSTTVCC